MGDKMRPLQTRESAIECIKHLLEHGDLYKFAEEVSDNSYRFGRSGTLRYMFLDFLKEEIRARDLSIL